MLLWTSAKFGFLRLFWPLDTQFSSFRAYNCVFSPLPQSTSSPSPSSAANHPPPAPPRQSIRSIHRFCWRGSVPPIDSIDRIDRRVAVADWERRLKSMHWSASNCYRRGRRQDHADLPTPRGRMVGWLVWIGIDYWDGNEWSKWNNHRQREGSQHFLGQTDIQLCIYILVLVWVGFCILIIVFMLIIVFIFPPKNPLANLKFNAPFDLHFEPSLFTWWSNS